MISLIVRTRDRPRFLAQALASVARSTYRGLEVLVVNDGGHAPELPREYPVPLTLTNLPANRGRAGAANAGIVRARGRYVAFLDDDDLVEPEHFAVLSGLVADGAARVAYTDAAVGIYEATADGEWRCLERRVPYSRDFDPERLLFDNYIPFNTLLIERGLLAVVGGLDEDLPIFEDWDLLIRLSRHAAFRHLARVTCEYRLFRDPGHHGLGERPRERPEFLAMKARIIGKHGAAVTPDVMARVIDRLRAETVGEQETVAGLRREVATSRREIDERDREIRAMQGTRAWRLAEAWRQLRRRLPGVRG